MPDAARLAYEVYANEMDPAAEAEAEALLRVLADARLAASVRTNHRPDAPPDERSTRKKMLLLLLLRAPKGGWAIAGPGGIIDGRAPPPSLFPLLPCPHHRIAAKKKPC